MLWIRGRPARRARGGTRPCRSGPFLLILPPCHAIRHPGELLLEMGSKEIRSSRQKPLASIPMSLATASKWSPSRLQGNVWANQGSERDCRSLLDRRSEQHGGRKSSGQGSEVLPDGWSPIRCSPKRSSLLQRLGNSEFGRKPQG